MTDAADATAEPSPVTPATGDASASLAATLAQLHAQGVGLDVTRAVWIADAQTRAETYGDALAVYAPNVEAAGRLLVAHVLGRTGTPGTGEPLPCAASSNGAVGVRASVVDLRDVKREAQRVLPRGHPVREGLEREPDALPPREARAKLETYLRLLILHRGRHG